jgi:hypothetical protein
MHRKFAFAALCAALLVPCLKAQYSSSADTPSTAVQSANAVRIARLQREIDLAPFSRMAFGGGVSSSGVNVQTAVIVSQHLNIRGFGNTFKYTVKNIAANDFNATGKINLVSAGVALDYFPWARHGFRVSPGIQFHNENGVDATLTAAGGTSFTLNDVTYYASKTNPVTGAASLNLHKNKIDPMMTIGWGNMIPRNGGHWSFPIELGVLYTGDPQLGMQLVSGQVCSDPAGTLNCQNAVGNQSIKDNLAAEVAKDQKDLEPLRIYPVLSFGVGYSFGLRGER